MQALFILALSAVVGLLVGLALAVVIRLVVPL